MRIAGRRYVRSELLILCRRSDASVDSIAGNCKAIFMVAVIGQVCFRTFCDCGKWMGFCCYCFPLANSSEILIVDIWAYGQHFPNPQTHFWLCLPYWNRMPNESNELWHTKPVRLNQTPPPPLQKKSCGRFFFNLITCFDRQEVHHAFMEATNAEF